jgi:hypothetical protein
MDYNTNYVNTEYNRSNIEIIVYDDYKIPLNKYPRNETDKRETDILITIFLMHEDYLKKLAVSYSESIKFYNNCKEYFYIFKFKKETRKYSAQDIMMLINKTNEYFRDNPRYELQIKFLNNLPLIDRIFYFYIKNKDFYVNLFESLEHAKKAYFERREYNYRIIPPNDFYNNLSPKIYSALELMELNAYAQFLIQNKIICELPIPKYFN